jgi:hypothetical protein
MENKRQRSLVCFSIELLYKIADAGYLENLNEVRPNRKRPNRKIYYFDPDPDLEKIINDYQAEREKEKAEKLKENHSTYTLSDEDKQSIIDGIVSELKSNKAENESSDKDA